MHVPQAGLLARRVENKLEKGFPDVVGSYYSRGYLAELKYQRKPARTVDLTHYTYEQANFIEMWNEGGGMAFLFVGVGHSLYILPPVIDPQSRPTEAELIQSCWAYGKVNDVVSLTGTAVTLHEAAY